MKKSLLNSTFLLIILGLVWWAVQRQPDLQALRWLEVYFTQLREFYEERALLALGLFGLAHFTFSSVGVPGGCTALNFLAGVVFGFWQGCLIVYPVTIFSAAFGFWLGRHFAGKPFLRKYQAKTEVILRYLEGRDFLFLVSVRLSPFLPFGVLNIVFGMLKVPFPLFLTTTFIGVFFDVVLLNSLGAAFAMAGVGELEHKYMLVGGFIILLILFVLLRALLLRSPYQHQQKTVGK